MTFSRINASERGQMTIEIMLLMAVFLMVGLSVQQTAIQKGWVKGMIEGPWTRIQGMIEDGVWMNAGASKAYHPSLISRKGSLKGDPSP